MRLMTQGEELGPHRDHDVEHIRRFLHRHRLRPDSFQRRLDPCFPGLGLCLFQVEKALVGQVKGGSHLGQDGFHLLGRRVEEVGA